VRSYLGKEARKEVLKRLPPPRVLHLSTHGFFLPAARGKARAPEPSAPRLARLRSLSNPLLRSGFFLAGANRPGPADTGCMTAEEVGLLDLRGCELVVLSFGESGRGEIQLGEGSYGLARAFLSAGARSLLISLHNVTDRGTAQLMSGFYQGLAAGKGKLEALHQAQREQVRRRRLDSDASHPFFWASFVLLGDPR
jgi:CHAT domain-containing protein